MQQRPRLGEGFLAAIWTTLGCLLIAFLMWMLLPIVVRADAVKLPAAVHLGGTCTAFYIGNERFLTAGHCVLGDMSPLKVEFPDKRTAQVDIIAISSPAQSMPDFAVLQLKSSYRYYADRIDAMSLNCGYEPKIGDEVSMTGYPQDLGSVTTWGKVSRAAAPWAVWKLPVFGVNIGMAGGSSGSAIVAGDGRTVAILVGGPPENRNLAMVQPVTPVCKLLGLM